MATDLDDLTKKLDGNEVSLGEISVRLRTSTVLARTLQMVRGERLLALI